MSARAPLDVLVIGGGVAGLATLEHLSRRGGIRAALVERHRVGHDGGGSHGHSRITRSTYVAADYVRLAAHAHSEEWPRLEHDAGARLLHPAPGCFFGPPGPTLTAYRDAVLALPGAVEELSPAEGRVRFPAFAFPDTEVVLADRTAALVAADDTLNALARLATQRGAAIREQTEVLEITPRDDAIEVRTTRESFVAQRVVIASGAWTSRLLPGVTPTRRIRPVHQTVAYFALDAPATAHRIPAFPVWAYLEEGHLAFYGLPEHGRPGIKAACHIVTHDDDPDAPPSEQRRQEAIAGVRTFLDEQLAIPVTGLLHAESCLYACTPDEDFVIDTLPGDSRVVVLSGLSGHGFKFAPLLGRLAGELVLDGQTTVPAFERSRARFRLVADD